MKNTKVYLPSTELFQTAFMEDVNISQEEIIANQAALHSTQPIRNLPNILRSNTTRVYKNYKAFTLDNIETSFAFSTEDMNTFELNTILSNSVDSEMEANYNKITSSKSHHQRKQVHNPLDIQYDTPDWNNNRDKNISHNINQLDTIHVSSSHEESAPMKKLKYNKQKRCSFKKKSRRVTTRKSGSRTKTSYKKLDSDNGLTTVSDMHTKDNIVQNTNNFCSNDILIQSICAPNTSNSTNDLNEPKSIETKSIESSNVFCYNNEIYNLEKKYDNKYNPVISSSSTKFNIMQHKTFQKDLTNYEFPITENCLKEKLIDRNMASNFLFKSQVLYTCTCANCMSYEKDIIFYEDPPSTPTRSDMETELLTCDFYTNVYDFYVNDYYHILDGNWLKEFDKVNPCCEELKETNIIKENVCTGSSNITKLIESDANVPFIEQNESQNSQLCYIDRLQDICVESHSTEPCSNAPTKFLKSTETVNVFDEMDYLNPESIFMKEGKIISQDEAHIQTPIMTDTSVPNSKCQPEKNKEDLYVIQCGQCGKLFNKKHQFSKHFTRCDFADKEDFKCHICNKIYRHKSSLSQHLRNAHQVPHDLHEKFYICNKCSKSYIRLRAFQRHILLHDDD